MENKDKAQYLPEDQDIIDQLESISLDAVGQTLERRKGMISKLQIQAILRSRKQTADYDKSNKRFTIVLGAFALLQIVIAGFQFVVEISNSENKYLAGFIAVVFAISIFWFTREMDKILKDK